jgi:hypothetical protein
MCYRARALANYPPTCRNCLGACAFCTAAKILSRFFVVVRYRVGSAIGRQFRNNGHRRPRPDHVPKRLMVTHPGSTASAGPVINVVARSALCRGPELNQRHMVLRPYV